ncbi:hypothetical protein HDV02_000539 [Globomyces sp. JEL0801]|nr:hypothetical protein HDV02_000539 [Globomyces sp. JEL0801]
MVFQVYFGDEKKSDETLRESEQSTSRRSSRSHKQPREKRCRTDSSQCEIDPTKSQHVQINMDELKVLAAIFLNKFKLITDNYLNNQESSPVVTEDQPLSMSLVIACVTNLGLCLFGALKYLHRHQDEIEAKAEQFEAKMEKLIESSADAFENLVEKTFENRNVVEMPHNMDSLSEVSNDEEDHEPNLVHFSINYNKNGEFLKVQLE